MVGGLEDQRGAHRVGVGFVHDAAQRRRHEHVDVQFEELGIADRLGGGATRYGAGVPGVLLHRGDAEATPVVNPAADVGDSDDLAAQDVHQPREPGADIADPWTATLAPSRSS